MLTDTEFKRFSELAMRADVMQLTRIFDIAKSHTRMMVECEQIVSYIATGPDMTTYRMYTTGVLHPRIADGRVVTACRWLCQHGYMYKHPEPGDARVYRWRLTDKGKALVADIKAGVDTDRRLVKGTNPK